MSKPERWVATVALALAAQLVFATCGGGATSKDAAVVPWDGEVGADAPGCAALPCLAGATGLVTACAPSGTCTQQLTVSGTTTTMAKCFSNGVKILLAEMRAASGAIDAVMTVRKDGAACYSFTTMSESTEVGSIVYKDGAGTELVSEMASGATLTVTCPGGSAIVQDGACDVALFALGGLYPFTNATNCTTGTCAF